MSLFNVFDLAGSALSAQSLRLNLTASNLANADSVSSSMESTYRARHPVFEALPLGFGPLLGAVTAGVRVRGVLESKAPLPKEYRPDHPAADADGYVYRSNVNAVAEMADMISASRSYQGNVEVVDSAKQMLLRTLAMGRE
jgi:flagellar basal-body rod protein FlgC